MDGTAVVFGSNVGTAGGFAGQIQGQSPHAVDRELSAILKDNYQVVDGRRGKPVPPPDISGGWERLDNAAVRAAGIDPTLLHDSKSGFDASLYRNGQGAIVVAYAGTDEL